MIIDKSKYMIIERNLGSFSLTVKPLDNTSQPSDPFGEVELGLKDHTSKPIKNTGGYFIFFTLEDVDYTVKINSQYYLTKKFTVTLPDHGLTPGDHTFLDDPANPKKKLKEVKLTELKGGLLAEVSLMPEVNYQFPSGSTLIRGEIKDAANNPVATAFLNVLGSEATPVGLDLVYAVNSKGQFVLFCNRLTSDEIKEINGKRYEGGRRLKLQAFDDSLGDSAKFDVEISDGKTVYQNITY